MATVFAVLAGHLVADLVAAGTLTGRIGRLLIIPEPTLFSLT